MFKRKCGEREPIRSELEAQNISYRPVIWTTYGRPHAQAAAAINGIAKRLARKRGCKTKTAAQQIRSAVGVCLARRAARMSLACWPRLDAQAENANLASELGAHFLQAPGETQIVGSPQTSAGPPAARDVRLQTSW